ncbi:hypothetical protein MCOR27_005803 [Pyricularia oryzae]|uniref:Amidase domain-containing protein n=1 Tax=Pyricularia grisea TaxID=148305 RepID=A0ABQ8P010_PYRGI|nr:hypothetical protein MCOR01_009699 [Pyricularia oryzae]KAI6304282.1 hypothetical protein MCOR33_000593 [Pyricularia grisea]KAI6253012.1 hypothetical protein MCOR19_010406 [Pyricularia oryzae]KAI6278052.1 hypothetical protein MCOR27_005803 [Pyricularia oryzae]KAI6280904.1 hypothetical protein MCOR26_003479 [Pyricularia oryzae]
MRLRKTAVRFQPIVAFKTGLLLLAHTITATAFGLEKHLDVRSASISSLHDALFSGQTTCRTIISAHISRIQAFNPIINAITALDPACLSAADALDAQLAAGNVTGRPLFCIPVLLKDSFDAAGMSTAAGCLALARNRPRVDSPTVAALRSAGAVVLGRASMHELALEGISASSLAGQVRNPYDLRRTPGGSSGGSGAAVAAGFAVLATGTDTVNSLRSPASANGLCSFRPTTGLVSKEGIVPVSATQDAIGAMGRSVEDIAVALQVMAGARGEDVPDEVVGTHYVKEMMEGDGLKGLRLGVVDGFFNHTADPETDPVNNAMESMMSLLKNAGVTIVNITDPVFDAVSILTSLDVQRFEYKEQLGLYLGRTDLDGEDVPRSFDQLYHGNRESQDFVVLPYQYDFINKSSTASTSDDEYKTRQAGIRRLTEHLAATFATHSLEALIYPQQKNLVVEIGSPSQAGRNGILAALTGSPVVVVPAGYSPEEGGRGGVPIGMEILGMSWTEGRLLGIARSISQLPGAPAWRMPGTVNSSVEVRAYEEVPVIVPDRGSVPPEYPLGNLWHGPV